VNRLKKYHVLFKITIALVLALVAFIVPIWGIKIGLAFLAVIFFALSFRKFSWLIILVGTIITLSAMGIMIISNFIPEINKFFNYDFGFFIPFVANMNDSSKMNLLEANHETAWKPKIYFYGTSFKISKKENGGMISLPDSIEFKQTENSLVLRNNYNNRTAEIIVDKNIQFELFYAETGVISIVDDFNAKDFKIYSSVININGNLISEGTMILNGTDTGVISIIDDFNAKDFKIPSSVININGNLISGNTMVLNGSVINIKNDLNSPDSINISGMVSNLSGTYSTKKLEISSSVSNLSIDVMNIDNFKINSSTISGSIDYTDNWNGERNLDITASIGNLDITYDSGPNNLLTYSTSGKAKISVIAK